MPARGDEKRQEIEFLLSCLVDTEGPDSRAVVLERLLFLIPFGHHPSLYVEQLNDPGVRLILREQYLRFLNELKLRHDLKKLMEDPRLDVDLERGAFLISRLGEDMEITPEQFRDALDEIADPLRETLAAIPAQDHEERIAAFRQFLFVEQRFSGNTDNYYDPQNSFLTHVLERRMGIPVSLSVLCMLIGQRVDLPLYGVNLPGHFILKYSADDYVIYLDPFNDGNLLSENDCLNFLVRQGLEPSSVYLARTSSLTILKRMYRNLINYHSACGNVRMEKILRQHFSILENHSIRS